MFIYWKYLEKYRAADLHLKEQMNSEMVNDNY